MQMTSKQRRYSYVDLTLHQHQQQQQTTSGNSLAGSSVDLSSVNTPLVAAPFANAPTAPKNPLHFCCECRVVTSGCCGGDRKSCAGDGGLAAAATSGMRVVGYSALEQTMSVRMEAVAGNDRQQVAPGSKVTMQQTDDVKLQRSLCARLSPPPPPPTGGRVGSEPSSADDDYGSRDADAAEKPTSACNRNESLVPMQIF